ADSSGVVVTVAKDVHAGGVGQIELDALGTLSRIWMKDDVVAQEGEIHLLATDSVDKLDGAVLGTDGMAVVTAANGLRIVDATGTLAAGTVGRAAGTANGVLRIEGNQTLATGQTLALRLGDTGAGDHDTLEVTGTLTLAQNVTLDVVIPSFTDHTGFKPQLGDTFDLIQAGSLTGKWSQAKGLFGYDAGNTVLSIKQSTTGLVLDTVKRAVSEVVSIVAHSKTDADTLGMFFNADYFANTNAFTVGMTLTSSQFLTVDGRFQLSNSLVDGVKLSDGATVKSRRWLIGGDNLQAFVGLNGPYRLDTDHDGNLTEETTNPTAAGFELTGLDIGLALYMEQAPAGDPELDRPRNWVSLSATSETATEYGLSMVEATASTMAVSINVGTDGQTVVDYQGAPLAVATGNGLETRTLDFLGTSGTLIKASGEMSLTVGEFFHVAGSLGFEKSSREVVLADGSKVKTDTLAFGGEGLYAFAGVGGPYWGAADSLTHLRQPLPGSAAVGLALEDADFALLLASAKPGQGNADGLSWVALSATAGSVGLVGADNVTMKVSDLAVDLNLVSGVGAGFSADSKVIDFAAEGGQVDIITGTGHSRTLDMDGELGVLVRASASGQLKVGDFIDLSGSLGFERHAQKVVLADGEQVQTQMVSVGGTGLTGFVGLGPYATDNNHNGVIDRDANGVILSSELNPAARGVAVRGVEFGLGLFSSTDSGYSNTRWTALTASVGHVDTLVGLPADIDFQIRDLGVDINLVSGLAADVVANDKVINFSGTRTVDGVEISNAVTLSTGTGKSLELTHAGDRGQMVRASGGMTLDVAGFFMVSGTMSMEKSSHQFTLADASPVNTDMLTLGGTGLNAFVGANGPYRRDTNGDGTIDLDDDVNLNAVGLTLTEAEFGLALIYEKTGTRNWIALEASALEVGLVGVPGVTATAQNLSVGINQVYGVATGSNANTQVIDFSGDKGLAVYTGYGETMTLDLAGSKGELIQASGDFALSIADFVTVRGSLAFEKSIGSIQANGESHLVDTIRVGGTGISAFAGVGGPYFVDSNGDGRIVVSGVGADTPNSNATGFALTNATFALVIASTPEDATRLNGVSWLGLELQTDSVAFVGVDAITMEVSDILVEVNQVYGLAPNLEAVDYVAAFDKMADPANHLTPMTVTTGPTTSRTLTLDGDKGPLIRASADVQIGVGGLFYAGGSLGFEKSVRTLKLANGTQVSHDVLTVGGHDLQAFAGINGGPVESLGDDAVGFLLSGVEFGLVVASEQEVLTQTLVENLTWKGVAISDYRLVDGVRIEGSRQVAISNGATGSNIWISEDQGLSWQAVPLGTQGLNFSGVTISDDGLEIVCVVAEGGLLTSNNGGRDWVYDTSIVDSYTAVTLTGDGEIITADQRSKRQFDVITIWPGLNGGGFVLGDTLTIKGLSTSDVVYTVVAEDLTSDGASSTTTATTKEASTNIAKKLAKALNDAAGGLATATANGVTIELVAKGSGTQAGWYDIGGGIKSDNRLSFLLLSREAVPGRGIGQRDVFKITGSFAVGDVIAMDGITNDGSTLYYTVQEIDLKVDRKADGKKATSEQAWTNVMTGIKAFFDEPVEVPKAIQRLQEALVLLYSLNLFGTWDAEVSEAESALSVLMAYKPPTIHSTVLMEVVDGVMVFTGFKGTPPCNLDIEVLDKNGKVKAGNKVLSSEGSSNQPQRGNLRISASLKDQVNITGTFAAGDVIILEGITTDRPFLSYTVTANDLLANGVKATPEQVWANVMIGIQKIFDEPAERIRLIDNLKKVLAFLTKVPPTTSMVDVVHDLEMTRNEILGDLDILSPMPANLSAVDAAQNLKAFQGKVLGALDVLSKQPENLSVVEAEERLKADRDEFQGLLDVFQQLPGNISGVDAVHSLEGDQNKIQGAMQILSGLAPDHPVNEAVQGLETELGNIQAALDTLYPLPQPHPPEVVAQVFALEADKNATLVMLGILHQLPADLPTGEAVQRLATDWSVIGEAVKFLKALPQDIPMADVVSGVATAMNNVLGALEKLHELPPDHPVIEAVQWLAKTRDEIPAALYYLSHMTSAQPVVGEAVSRLEVDRGEIQMTLGIFHDFSSGPLVVDAVLGLEAALDAALAYHPPAESSIVSLKIGQEGMLFSSLNDKQPFSLKIHVEGSDGHLKADNQVAQNTLLPVRPYLSAGQWLDEHWTALVAFDTQLPNTPVTHSLLAAAGTPVLGNGPSGLYLGSWTDGNAPIQWHDLTPVGAAGMDWTSVAVNHGPESGKVLVAVGKGSQIYINHPVNGWQVVGETRNWSSVAVSDDGKTIVAAASGSTGGIWASNDCGVTWRLVHGSEGLNWRSVALTADGLRLTAVADNRGIFTTRLNQPGVAMPTRVALEAEAQYAGLVGLPEGFELSVQNVKVGVNLADSDSHQVVDFKATPFEVVTGTGTTHQMSLNGKIGEQLQVAADFTLRLDQYVYLDGSAAFEKKSSIVTLANKKTVTVDALTMGASQVTAFVGVGLTDRNDDHRIDSHDLPGSNAQGLYMGAVDLALGLFTAKANQIDNTLLGMSWLALSAQAGTVVLAGLPGVTFTGSDFQIQVNRVTDLPANLAPNIPINQFKDAYSIDITGEHALSVLAGPNVHVDLAMESLGEQMVVGGTVDLSVASMVSVSGSVRVKLTRADITLADTATPVAADLLVIGGANLAARVAAGAGSDALGVELTGLDMALVLASTSSSTDNRRWFSLSGTAEKAGLVGTAAYGLTAMGSNLALDINMGLGTNSDGTANKSAINWSGAPIVVALGDGTTRSLSFTGETFMLAGTMELAFSDFFKGSGSLAISRVERTIKVGGQRIDATGFLVGAAGLSAEISGIHVTNVSLGLALMSSSRTAAGDARSWLAMSASVGSVTIKPEDFGLPQDMFKLQANNLALQVNLGLGKWGGVDNDQVMDLGVSGQGDTLYNGAITVATGAAAAQTASVSLNYGADAGEFVSLVTDATLQIGAMVSLSGTLAFTRAGSRSVTLDDGKRRSMNLTTIVATGVDVQIGLKVGTADFVGVELQQGSLGLMLLQDTQGAGSFMGLRAGASQLSLEGVDGLELDAQAMLLSMNKGFGTGELAGRVVDFTQGDIDGNGRADGFTSLTVRGQALFSLDDNTARLEAESSLHLAIHTPGAAANATPLLQGSGDFKVVESNGVMVLAGTHLQAAVNLSSEMKASVVDGTVVLVLNDGGFALEMEATAKLPLPGAFGISAFGSFGLELNRTGADLNQSVVVGGETITLNYANDYTRFTVGELDATIGEGMAMDLAEVALGLSDAAATLREGADLPVIGQSLDELLDLSSILGVGDYMLHYLQPLLSHSYESKIGDLEPVNYGTVGEPTFRNMLAYLNDAWLKHNLASGEGLQISKLGGNGFALSFDGDFKRHVGFGLDLANQMDGLGIELLGQAQVTGNLEVALDFDFDLDWTNGAQFNVNDMHFAGDLAASDIVLAAGLGPINLSIGRNGVSNTGQAWKKGSAAISMSGGLSLVDGQFNLIAPGSSLSLDLPVYAAVAGMDLTTDANALPTVKVAGNFLAGNLLVTTEHFDQFNKLSKLTLTDVLAALPEMLKYLETMDPAALGLEELPFVEQSISSLLDLAAGFKAGVIDKVDFYRDPVAWVSTTGETQSASGKGTVSADGTQIAGVTGQFAASMTGSWVTVGQETVQIRDVAADGSALTVSTALSLNSAKQDYLVHQALEKIKTLDEFVDALNESGLLGTSKATFDATTGELRVPVRFAHAFDAMEAPIKLGLGGNAAPISLSTSAEGEIDVNLQAGFDLIIKLGDTLDVAIDEFAATADIGLSVSDLEIAARLGFVGLTAGGVNTGSGITMDAAVNIALDRTPGANGVPTFVDANGKSDNSGRFAITDLGNAFQSIVLDVDGAASASVKGLSIQAGSVVFDMPNQPELGIYVQDLLDWDTVVLRYATDFDLAKEVAAGLDPHAVVIVLPPIEGLLDMSKLSMADILGAIRTGLNLVDQLAGDQPFYVDPLPVINQSLQSIMDVGDTWLGALENVAKDPVTGLDEAEHLLEESLGIDDSLLDFTLDAAHHKLYLDLDLAMGLDQNVALDLNLADLVAMAGGGLILPDGFEKWVDASGGGDIHLTVGAELQLRLGITLPDTSGGVQVAVEDYDAVTGKGTRLALTARLMAENAALNFSVGPIELGVANGVVAFDADGDATTTAPAALQIALVNGKPQIDLVGAFNLSLPLTAKLLSSNLPIGKLLVQTDPKLGDQGLATLINQGSGLIVKLPDFDFADTGKSGLIGMLNDPSVLLDGVDLGLGAVQDLFESSMAAKIPFIGAGLTDAGNLIGGLRGGLLQDLRLNLAGPGKPVAIVRDTLFNAFSSSGLNILQDRNNDHLITIDDIDIAFYNVAGKRLSTWQPGQAVPRSGVDAIRFDMDLGGTILDTGLDIPLDLDLPGFSLNVDGGFSLGAEWHYDFGFGISSADGFFLSTNTNANDPELNVELKAFLDGNPLTPEVTPFSGSGSLLFFNAAITDKDSSPEAGFQGSNVTALLTVDLKGNTSGRLTLDKLVSAPQDVLTAVFDVNADINLGLELSATNLPKLKADFVLDWDWRLGDPSVAFPHINIENIRMDMQSALLDFLLPIATKVSSTLEPFREVIEALVTPVSGLDTILNPARSAMGLAPDPTIRGLIDTLYETVRVAKKLPPIDWAFLDAARFALQMPDMLRSLVAMGSGLPLGSLYDLGTVNYHFVAGEGSSGGQPMSNTVMNSIFSGMSAVTTKASGGSTTAAARSGLQVLPYLTDIGNWAKIFSGGSATLFTYELPLLQFSAGFDVTLVTIPTPVGINVVVGALGNLSAYVDLSFGFDTFGVQKAFASGSPLDVVDGFYLNDWTLPEFKNGAIVPGTGGKEKPEFGLSLELGLRGGLGIGPVSAGIGGSITVKVNADLNDIKKGTVTRNQDGQLVSVSYAGDGKVRASELVAMMTYPGPIPGVPGGLLNLFDTYFQGFLTAFLWGKVSLPWPFSDINVRINLFSVSLFSSDFKAPTVMPELGSYDSKTGVLTLLAGPRSAERLYLNTMDAAENWIVSGNKSKVDVEFMGFVKSFTNVNKVVVDLGVGNDKLDASALNQVVVQAYGGEGDDTILLGGGGGTVIDTEGNNTLRALATGTSVVYLIGGRGDDKLSGGLGPDILYGGAGNNELIGGGGDDTLYAVQGINKLSGGDGEDLYVFTGELGLNIVTETGKEMSRVDFSGALSPELLGLIGPTPGAPLVSAPSTFTQIRGIAARLLFYGTPFEGDPNLETVVTLSIADGVFKASSMNGVTVGGNNTAKLTLTGKVADLNKYITSSNAPTYTFTSGDDVRTLSVEIKQNEKSNIAYADILAMHVSATSQSWRDMVQAGDLLVAVSGVNADQTGVYLSRDKGLTWSRANTPKGVSYSMVSASSNGGVIAAMNANGSLTVSRDGGLTWTNSTAPANNYADLLVLEDGRILVSDRTDSAQVKYFNNIFDWGTKTVYSPGEMRILDASGKAWTTVSAPNANWNAMSSNADGSKLLAVSGVASNKGTNGGIYMAIPKANGSITWVDITRGAATNGDWIGVDMDASGTHMVAAARGGQIYLADTTKPDWTWSGTGLTGQWTSVWMSDDAKSVVATANGGSGGVWLSTNGGIAWTRVAGQGTMGVEPGRDWRMATFNPTTGQMVAIIDGAPILTFEPPPTSLAANIILPEQMFAGSNDPTDLVFAKGTLADGDSQRLTVTISATSGTFTALSPASPVDTKVNVVTVTPSSANSSSVDRVSGIVDGNSATKYLNMDGPGSGLILTLSAAERVTRLDMTTRNNDDNYQWDPKTYALYGSNDDLMWQSSAWVAVASGATGLGNGRGVSNTVTFSNDTAYKYYKLVFPEVKGVKDGKSYMQLSEVALYAPNLTVHAGEVLTLNGVQKDIVDYLSKSGNVQFVPGAQGANGTISMVVEDGLNRTEQKIPLIEQDPFAMKASYDAGNFEIFADSGSGLRFNRGALGEIRLGELSDELTVMKLTDSPSILVVKATPGADKVTLFAGNTRSQDGSLRTMDLQDDNGQLSDDTLELQLKPVATSPSKNLIKLGSGQLISGVEQVLWDETLGTLSIKGDNIHLVALTGGGDINLGAHTTLKITADHLSIEGNLYADAYDFIGVDPTHVMLNGNLYTYAENGSAVAFELPGSVHAITPQGAGLVDLTKVSSGNALQIVPASSTMPISLGGNAADGGVQIDPKSLAAKNLPSLVLGADGGSNPINVGQSGSTLTLNTPLVLMAQGKGGEIQIGGTLNGTSLQIYGSGKTTTFDDGTDLIMSEGLLIDDSLKINGTVSLGVGPAALSDIVVSGRINGGLGDHDVLTLNGNGHGITVNGRVGDGVGSVTIVSGGQSYKSGVYTNVSLTGGSGASATATVTVEGGIVTGVVLNSLGGGYQVGDLLSASRSSLGDLEGVASGFSMRVETLADLEGLVVTGGQNVTFNDRLYVEGDISITATGSVIFTDQVVMRNGGHLFISNAAQVQFLGGIRSEGTTEPALVLTGTNTNVDFGNGLLAGGSDTVHFGGVQNLELSTPVTGQTAPSLKVSGGALTMTEMPGGQTLRLNVATLDLSGTTLTFSPLGSVTQQITASDVRLTSEQGTGSLLAPLNATATTLSAQTTTGNICLNLDGNTTLVRQGVNVANGGDININVTGNLSMETAAVLSTTSGQANVTVTGASTLSTLGSTSGNMTVNSGGAVSLATMTSTGGSLVLTSKALTLNGTGINVAGSGNVTIIANGAMTMNDGSAIKSAAGEINTGAESLMMSSTSEISTVGGNIISSVAGDVEVSVIKSSTGNITLGTKKLTLNGTGLQTGGAGNITTTSSGNLFMSTASHITTDTGNINATSTGDVEVSLIKSDSGSITLGSANLMLRDTGLQTGGTGQINVTATGGLSMSKTSEISTDGGTITANVTGDVEVSVIESQVGSIRLAGAKIFLRDSGIHVHHGSGVVTVDVTKEWLMKSNTSVTTDTGTITINSGGMIQISHLQSHAGDVALDSGKDIIVVGSWLQPQIKTQGNLSLNADEGIGGYGFDRLYVDINELTARNRETGDVLISGWNGLKVAEAGVHSDSDKGWLVLMSGTSGLVKKAGQVSAINGQAACVSGMTMIKLSALRDRSMQGFDGYMVHKINGLPEVNTLDSFNERLAQEWTKQVEGSSTQNRLNSVAQDLSSRMQGLSDRSVAAFSATVVNKSGSPDMIAALLDAALQNAKNIQQEDMLGTNQLSNWPQSSLAARNEPVRGNAPQAQPEQGQPEREQPKLVQPRSTGNSDARDTTESPETATEDSQE
ncbi:MAG: hypothetical protein HQL95_03035, partial [Magnetococcales bacterium]|nr:hypothetical protein [Magnetococcales bacterium]